MHGKMMSRRRRILVSIITGIFGVLLLLPFLEYKEKRVTAQIQYYPDSQSDPELVWIENIYVNGHAAIPDQPSGEIEYKEKENQYRWDGFRNISLTINLKESDSLQFEMGYREGEDGKIPQDAVIEVRIKERSYQMPLRTFFNQTRKFVYAETRWKHWGRCAALFLLLSFVWYAFLGKELTENAGHPKTNKLKLWTDKIRTSQALYVMLWAAAARIYMSRWSSAYIPGGDTPTYLIDSLKELSWFHRMPVYQLFLFFVRKLLRCETEAMLFRWTAAIQILLGIAACAVMYLALKKVLKREWMAFAGAIVYAAQPFILFYEYNILTESFAIDMMVGLIWILASYLEKPSRKLAFVMGFYSLFLTLTRPSFLILFPVLSVFFLLKLFTEKKERPYTVWGIAGMLLSICLLLLYCGNNKRLTGQFMLCDVSYNNQISIIIENGLYENADYPEVAEIIHTYEPEGVDSLDMSDKIYEKYGYAYGVSYIKAVLREKSAPYISALYGKWKDYQSKPLWKCEYDLGTYFRTEFESLAWLLMPFNFLCITLLSVFEIIAGFYFWYRTKKVPWIAWGTAALILSIVILGFATLTHAIPQRICVCVIPLVIMQIAIIAERGLDILCKENEK